MEKLKLLSLEFFAARFGFNKEELNYGIAIINGEEKIPVILIRDKPVFINICEDIISPDIIAGSPLSFETAKFTETKEHYIFASGNQAIRLPIKIMDIFFSTKYFSPATLKHVVGGNF